MVNDLVCPVFVRYGKRIEEPIFQMLGYFQFGSDMLEEEIRKIPTLGKKLLYYLVFLKLKIK